MALAVVWMYLLLIKEAKIAKRHYVQMKVNSIKMCNIILDGDILFSRGGGGIPTLLIIRKFGGRQ